MGSESGGVRVSESVGVDGNSISGLHFDDSHNMLCQLSGVKHVVVYPPSVSSSHCATLTSAFTFILKHTHYYTDLHTHLHLISSYSSSHSPPPPHYTHICPYPHLNLTLIAPPDHNTTTPQHHLLTISPPQKPHLARGKGGRGRETLGVHCDCLCISSVCL